MTYRIGGMLSFQLRNGIGWHVYQFGLHIPHSVPRSVSESPENSAPASPIERICAEVGSLSRKRGIGSTSGCAMSVDLFNLTRGTIAPLIKPTSLSTPIRIIDVTISCRIER